MTARTWHYPALLAQIGSDRVPSRSALRVLVRRLRVESYPISSDPAAQRTYVRQAIVAILRPEIARRR